MGIKKNACTSSINLDSFDEVCSELDTNLVKLNSSYRRDYSRNIEYCLPCNSICKLIITNKMNTETYGTGYFVAENVIFTAAHCLYDIEEKAAYQVQVYVQKQSKVLYDPPEWVIYDLDKIIVSKYYKNDYNNDNKAKYDYGIIITKTKSNEYIPIIRLDGLTKIEIMRLNKIFDRVMIGYSGDKNNWLSVTSKKKLLDDSTSIELMHTIDTNDGRSGSPILLVEKKEEHDLIELNSYEASYKVMRSIGIHVSGKAKHYIDIYFNKEFMDELIEWEKDNVELMSISLVRFEEIDFNFKKNNSEYNQTNEENLPKNIIKNILQQGDEDYNKCKIGNLNRFGVYKSSTGDVYEGYFVNNKKHGKGKQTYSDGTIYEGEWINGNRQGKGILKYSSGNVYEGDFLNDKRNGNGKQIWTNGATYVGEWYDNKIQGKGAYKNANGDEYEEEFRNDKRHGEGKQNWSTGATYERGWHDGKIQGKGIFKSENGNIYEGNFFNNKKYGKGKKIWSNGYIYEGEWNNNKIQGKGIFRNASGRVYVGYFLFNKKHRKGRQIWTNGDTYEGEWINDKMQGKGIYKYANGDIYIGSFVNNKRHGIGKQTWSDGALYKSDWVDDKIEGKGISQYANGNIYEGDFINNKKHGKGKQI